MFVDKCDFELTANNVIPILVVIHIVLKLMHGNCCISFLQMVEHALCSISVNFFACVHFLVLIFEACTNIYTQY